MNECDYGKVRQVSKFYFIWEIPNFIGIDTKKSYFSPDFLFEDVKWSLLVEKKNGKLLFGVSFNSLDDDGSNPRTQTCRLCIKDVDENEYWSSKVLTFVFCDGKRETCLTVLVESDLQGDRCKIAPEDALSLHLTFFPGRRPPSKDIDKLMQDFKDLFLNGENSDVTLNVRGRAFPAHMAILKARSKVFAAMFRQEMLEKNSCVVDIDDCDPDAFRDFLLYLYSGTLEQLDGNSVVHLHHIGHKYDVTELATCCVKFMVENLTVDSFCDFVAVGLRLSEPILLESADNFFAINLKKVVATEKWRLFNEADSLAAHTLLNKALAKNQLSLISD